MRAVVVAGGYGGADGDSDGDELGAHESVDDRGQGC